MYDGAECLSSLKLYASHYHSLKLCHKMQPLFGSHLETRGSGVRRQARMHF